MIERAKIVAVIAVVAMVGCGEERIVGNSVETENSLSRELSVDSLMEGRWPPYLGSIVVPIRLNRWNFDFKKADARGNGLGFEQLDGRPLPYELQAWDSAANLGRVRVRLESNLFGGGQKIRLRSKLGDTAFQPDSIATWAWIPQNIKDLWTSVLLDDFEDGDSTTMLVSKSKWRSGSVGTGFVNGPIFDAAGNGRRGNALRATYSAPNGSYVVVATALGKVPHSLRAMDSLVFWMRGSGKMHVAFEHLKSGVGPKSWIQKTLDTAWTRVRIRPEDLEPAGAPGNIYTVYGWNTVRDSVTDLSFIVQDGSELHIDDIRLYGVDRDDFR
ncbi:MAG: hypothetical protein RL173_2362 [Fibrobacterota bacterium]|jgi:hypothetical protein